MYWISDIYLCWKLEKLLDYILYTVLGLVITNMIINQKILNWGCRKKGNEYVYIYNSHHLSSDPPLPLRHILIYIYNQTKYKLYIWYLVTFWSSDSGIIFVYLEKKYNLYKMFTGEIMYKS